MPFQRAVFACCCAQRLLKEAGIGEGQSPARLAVDLAWDLILGDPDDDPEAMLDELEALGDELDQDALAASFFALATAARGGAETAGWAGQRGTDHAFEVVSQDVSLYRPLEIDATDPVVQREYQAQRSYLNRVSRAPTPAGLGDLRQSP